MTDEQAGGFPIAFRTACAGLVKRAPVEPGQTLLRLWGVLSERLGWTSAASTATAAIHALREDCRRRWK